MPIGLLGIAQGAVAIGQKLFGGIKKRREAKIAKKAQRLLEQNSSLQNAARKFGFSTGIVEQRSDLEAINSLINPGGGLQAISGAANNLLMMKGNQEAIQPTAANVALEERVTGPGRVNPMLLIGGAFILILLFITKRGR